MISESINLGKVGLVIFRLCVSDSRETTDRS